MVIFPSSVLNALARFFFVNSTSQSINAILISVKSKAPLKSMSRLAMIVSISWLASTPTWENALTTSSLLMVPSQSESSCLNKDMMSCSLNSIFELISFRISWQMFPLIYMKNTLKLLSFIRAS